MSFKNFLQSAVSSQLQWGKDGGRIVWDGSEFRVVTNTGDTLRRVNVAGPIATSHAATKGYVDQQILAASIGQGSVSVDATTLDGQPSSFYRQNLWDRISITTQGGAVSGNSNITTGGTNDILLMRSGQGMSISGDADGLTFSLKHPVINQSSIASDIEGSIDLNANNISLSFRGNVLKLEQDAWNGSGARFINAADPTGAQDLATKNYVDNISITTSSIQRAAQGQPEDINLPWDAANSRLIGLAAPIQSADAATKQYVDTNSLSLSSEGWDAGLQRIQRVAAPVDDTDAVNQQWASVQEVMVRFSDVTSVSTDRTTAESGFVFPINQIESNTGAWVVSTIENWIQVPDGVTKAQFFYNTDISLVQDFVDNNTFYKQRIYLELERRSSSQSAWESDWTGNGQMGTSGIISVTPGQQFRVMLRVNRLSEFTVVASDTPINFSSIRPRHNWLSARGYPK